MNGIVRRFKRDGLSGVVRSSARRLGIVPDRPPMEVALERLASKPGVTIVQIGAHVGNTPNDPLWGFFQQFRQRPTGSLNAVLVEPISEYCRQLRENYAGIPGVSIENVAIAESEGERIMSRLAVDPADYQMPAYLSQLSSLKGDRMRELWAQSDTFKADQEFVQKHSVSETVQCITFDTLFTRNKISTVDLLQIDVEGYEYEILKTLNFKRWRPRYINLERIWLAENEWPCWSLLKGAGYTLEDFGEDTFCTAR